MVAIRCIVATSLLTGGLLVGAAPGALAQEACESYSGGCAEGGAIVGTTEDAVTGGAGVGGAAVTGSVSEAPGQLGGAGNAVSNPRTLPFTGGQLVLAAAVGLGAVTAGTAMVVAGRRRRLTPSL